MTVASDGASVVEHAAAKINLYLHVTGRGVNGYHLLDSLMVFAGIGDTLELRPANEFSLTVGGPFGDRLKAESDNLVLRAARAMRDLTGVRAGAAMRLTKRLPVSSGIGGGSADAAACIRGLSRLWGVEPEAFALENMALGLGADVPVCLRGVAAFASGVGERLKPVPDLPDLWMILANPGFAVSTSAVFKARTGRFSDAESFPFDGVGRSDFVNALAARRNDLFPPATRLRPEIREVLNCLEGLNGVRLARMSGSGATCFGLFDGESEARGALKKARAAHPGWWVRAVPMLAEAGAHDLRTTDLRDGKRDYMVRRSRRGSISGDGVHGA